MDTSAFCIIAMYWGSHFCNRARYYALAEVVAYSYTLLKILKGTEVFFLSHTQESLILFLILFLRKFWYKQLFGRMLYTTASKHLQKYEIDPMYTA